MSFQQGLSGLNSAAKTLDVIGNNIANASTVGFKGSNAQFADVYANALSGASGVTPGGGVATVALVQQFTQGNVEASTNPLDMAINGKGFFRIEQGGTTQYTRNGQFSLNQDGFIVNAQGANLTGYGIGANGLLAPGNPVPLKIDSADQPPKVTSEVQIQLQLDSRTQPAKKTTFDPADPETYSKQVPMNVYDTLGNAHTLSTFYVKSPTGNGTWNVYAAKDGTEIGALDALGKAQTDPAAVTARTAWGTASGVVPPVPADLATAAAGYATAAADAVVAAVGTLATADNLTEVRAAATAAAAVPGATPLQIDAAIAKALKMDAQPIGTLAFDTNGALDLANTGTAGKFNINIPVVPVTGAEMNLPVEINFAGTTQYGAATTERFLAQDGYKPGSLQRFSVSADGNIMGQYSNGQNKVLGQVVMASFTNPNGLQPTGNNAWIESTNSGVALIGTAGTGGMGALQASATEASNVDLTAELVNMITAQRAYQANAQTIKTQDSVLQTMVSLR